jgi:hypothetical protein
MFQNLSKRPIVLAGVVVGIVVLNMVILISWCIVKRRRAQMKQKLISFPYVNPDVSVSRLSAKVTPIAEEGYSQTSHESFQEKPSPLPRPPVALPTTNLKKNHPKRPLAPLAPQEIEIALPLLKSPSKSLQPPSAIKRGNSVDSASVYSVASASLDDHDRAFRSFALHPNTPFILPQAANDTLHEPHTVDPGYVWPSRQRQLLNFSLPQIEEELAPQSSMQERWKPRYAPRSRHGIALESKSMPPVPSFPKHLQYSLGGMSPVGPLIHTSSASSSTEADRIETFSGGSAAATSPPEIPPQSRQRVQSN